MKTITRLLTIIFSFILLSCSSQKEETLFLQAAGAGVTSQQLTDASRIISSRLKIYGINNSAAPEAGKNRIRIEVPDTVNPADIKDLLTVPGYLGFYETLLVNSNAKLACSTFDDTKLEDSVEVALRDILNGKSFKLFWSSPDSHSETCLYALETNSTGNPVLGQQDVESVSSSKDDSSQFYKIGIKFKSSSAGKWASLTRSSVGKPVAIVVDNRIIYNPVVRDPILTGSCEITGTFSKKEADYITALINNEPLPVSLSLLP